MLFCGTQTTRANIFVRNFSVCFGCDFMDIGIETAFCLLMRVADVVAGYFAFTAHRTYFAHVFDLLTRLELIFYTNISLFMPFGN